MKSKATSNLQTQSQRKEFWYQICQAWLDSGLTKVEFCAKRKVSKSALYQWLHYFEKHSNTNQSQCQLNPIKNTNNKSRSKSIFTPIAIQNEGITKTINSFNNEKSPAVEVVFPNGIKLAFNQEFNFDLVTQLMAIRG